MKTIKGVLYSDLMDYMEKKYSLCFGNSFIRYNHVFDNMAKCIRR